MDVLRRAFGVGGGDVRKHGHLFKPKDKGIIPRVADVCGVLKSLRPSSVVDFGSQRGALLWSMMAALPDANFVAVDRDPKYLGLLRCVERGLAGRRLTVVDADVTQHTPSPGVVCGLCRVAPRPANLVWIEGPRCSRSHAHCGQCPCHPSH